MLTLRSIKWPITGCNAGVVTQHNGAREDMKRVLFHPLVPVTFVEFVTIGRMPEEAGPLAHLRTDGVVEGPETARTELVPVAALEFEIGRAHV